MRIYASLEDAVAEYRQALDDDDLDAIAELWERSADWPDLEAALKAVGPRAPSSEGNGKKSPLAVAVLLQSLCAAGIAVSLFWAGWQIPSLAAAILAFGLATAWVNIAFVRSARGGGQAPAWLSMLERLRQYLASEGDDAQGGSATKVATPR